MECRVSGSLFLSVNYVYKSVQGVCGCSLLCFTVPLRHTDRQTDRQAGGNGEGEGGRGMIRVRDEGGEGGREGEWVTYLIIVNL